jgi:hypothetical protein
VVQVELAAVAEVAVVVANNLKQKKYINIGGSNP